MLQEITLQASQAVEELLAVAKLQPGDLFVVGCSSSEVGGEKIGTHSSLELAEAVLAGVLPVLRREGIFLAAQCCEHLNRALIVERQAAKEHRLNTVNVLPQPKAGGSFATAFSACCTDAVAVEFLQAAAGLDICNTLIGMHLRPVAVPVRLSIRQLGPAPLVAARTRPKFFGGSSAASNEALLY